MKLKRVFTMGCGRRSGGSLCKCAYFKTPLSVTSFELRLEPTALKTFLQSTLNNPRIPLSNVLTLADVTRSPWGAKKSS